MHSLYPCDCTVTCGDEQVRSHNDEATVPAHRQQCPPPPLASRYHAPSGRERHRHGMSVPAQSFGGYRGIAARSPPQI